MIAADIKSQVVGEIDILTSGEIDILTSGNQRVLLNVNLKDVNVIVRQMTVIGNITMGVVRRN